MTSKEVWRLITDNGVTGAFGLAADDCLAQRAGAGESVPTLRLYTYQSHQALVGRFQNIDNEIQRDFCDVNGIAIGRRPTGGGAIIMGHDQLGVALCVPGRSTDNYARARELMGHFSAGIVNGLQRLGIESGFKGKNDIEISGKKLVGLGIYRTPSGGLLFHASILVDLDIALMLQVLRTPFEKLSDKAIATVASRVTTINRETGRKLSIDEVRTQMALGFAESYEVDIEPGTFTDDELSAIAVLETQKYRSEDWVFQTTDVPDTFGSSKVKTPAGMLDIRVTMAGQMIKAILIAGDFFASEQAITEIEASLRWHTSETKALNNTIEQGFQRHASDLSSLPVESLQSAIHKAVKRARFAESAARSDPYGCFVNPTGVSTVPEKEGVRVG